MSAFARYSQEQQSSISAQTDSVLPASRKRKRASVAPTNGHSKENMMKSNRSKSMLPIMPISVNNGQRSVIEQPSTVKKLKQQEKKVLSPSYPTPYPQRRVIVSESHTSSPEKSSVKKQQKAKEEEEDEQVKPFR